MIARNQYLTAGQDFVWTVSCNGSDVEIEGLDAAMAHASEADPKAIKLIDPRHRIINLIPGKRNAGDAEEF